MSSTFIVGSTGLCGAYILKHAHNYYDKVYSISRKQPKTAQADSIHEIILDDNKDNNWVKIINDLQVENPTTFFSGLGTTKAKAGGIQNQYKIDHDLNLDIAKAAKAKGYKQFVLISSAHANKDSRFPYLKMKGELEDNIIDLGFDRTIILRPGVLLGERDEDKGFLNNAFVSLGNLAHNTRFSGLLGSPSHGEEVGKAALKASKTEIKEKVVFITTHEINEIAKKD